MNSTLKSLLFWVVLVVIGVLIWNFSTKFQQHDQSITFTQFMSWADSGSVANVTITGQEISGRTKVGESFRLTAPNQYDGLVNKLIDRGVTVTAKSPALQGNRSTLTSSNGDYAFNNLPPGDYVLTFDVPPIPTLPNAPNASVL